MSFNIHLYVWMFEWFVISQCSWAPLEHCGLWSKSGWLWFPALRQDFCWQSLLPSPELRPSWSLYLGTHDCGQQERINTPMWKSFCLLLTYLLLKYLTWPIHSSWLHQRTASLQWKPTHSLDWKTVGANFTINLKKQGTATGSITCFKIKQVPSTSNHSGETLQSPDISCQANVNLLNRKGWSIQASKYKSL